MKREGNRAVETPFGTFYVGFYSAMGDNGPEFYAVTESGEVTINNVTYSGTVYVKRFRHDGEYHVSVQHLTRWDGRHFQAASESASVKLSAALLPAIADLASDGDAVRAAKVRTLTSSLGYAVVDVNRDIDKHNKVAAGLRELGEDVPDLPRFDVPNERQS